MDKYRKFAGWLLAAVCVLALLLLAAACLDICLGGEGFGREQIALRITVLAPVLGLCLLIGLAAFPAARKGCKAADDTTAGRAMYRRGGEEKHAIAVFVMILVLAGAFILLGVINGGARDVLIKAVNICTECIGLG